MNTPLVTVGVVTYNSAEYIEETLNSIFNQDYQNIELIVSDDCSTDNTVEICRTWISQHEYRFNGTKLVTVDKNTGVSGNSNRALNEAHGEWYKCFDGDDVLESHAITNYINFINDHPNCSHIVAVTDVFNKINDKRDRKTFNMINKYFCGDGVESKRQYSVISKLVFVSCITYFAKTALIRSVGGFDERFPLREDFPLVINTMSTGNKLYFMECVTALYRVRPNSISHSSDNYSFFSKNEVRYIIEYKLLYRLEHLKGIWRIFHYYSNFVNGLIIRSGNNKKKLFCWFLWVIRALTDPFVWYRRYIVCRVRLWNKFCINAV